MIWRVLLIWCLGMSLASASIRVQYVITTNRPLSGLAQAAMMMGAPENDAAALAAQLAKKMEDCEKAAKAAADAAAAAANPANNLLSAARAIGVPGKNSGVRVVNNADDLNKAFSTLSEGGKPIQVPNYNGNMVKFPDGSTVGLRNDSLSGGPTIDVRSGGSSVKIHVQ